MKQKTPAQQIKYAKEVLKDDKLVKVILETVQIRQKKLMEHCIEATQDAENAKEMYNSICFDM